MGHQPGGPPGIITKLPKTVYGKGFDAGLLRWGQGLDFLRAFAFFCRFSWLPAGFPTLSARFRVRALVEVFPSTETSTVGAGSLSFCGFSGFLVVCLGFPAGLLTPPAVF